eukprot:GHRQ01007959.1.p1 GENE.GHRQ01007959.1~~GHRQ01007959.1.p1  ORF type:complete len:152 (-),score=11.60 GHRQ01007959.1:420-875(-)
MQAAHQSSCTPYQVHLNCSALRGLVSQATDIARDVVVRRCCTVSLQMLDLGERLIKAGVLYADDTPVDQMREVGAHPTGLIGKLLEHNTCWLMLIKSVVAELGCARSSLHHCTALCRGRLHACVRDMPVCCALRRCLKGCLVPLHAGLCGA